MLSIPFLEVALKVLSLPTIKRHLLFRLPGNPWKVSGLGLGDFAAALPPCVHNHQGYAVHAERSHDTHVKDPADHVRVRWIMETQKNPACTESVQRLPRTKLDTTGLKKPGHGAGDVLHQAETPRGWVHTPVQVQAATTAHHRYL